MAKLTGFQRKKKNCKFACIIIYTLYSIIIAGVAYGNWKSKGAEYQETVDIWKQVPVSNVTLISAGQSCPASWEPWDVAGFPGSSRFCWCGYRIGARYRDAYPDATAQTGAVCNVSQITDGCFAAGPFTSLSFVANTKKLCAYRLRGSSSNNVDVNTPDNEYTRPRVYGRTATCPSGYKICGNPNAAGVTADTEFTCVRLSDTCPITKMARVSNANAIGWDECGAANSWGTGFTACFNRTGSSVPTAKVDSFIPYACAPGQSNLKKDATDFRLSNGYGCSERDARWVDVISTTEQALYVENNVTSIFQSWIAQHGLSQTVSYRNSVPWKENCPRTRLQLADSQPAVKQLTDAQLALLIMNIILGIVDCVYGFWECRQDDAAGWEDDSKYQMRDRRLYIGCTILFSFGKIVPIAITLAIANRLRNMFSDVKKYGCAAGDPLTQSSLDFFASETDTQSYLNIALLVAVCLVILYNIYEIYLSIKAANTDWGSCIGHIDLTVHRGRDLRNTERVGKQDPYVRVFVEDKEYRTNVHKDGGTEPVFEQTFSFDFIGTERQLQVQIFNQNSVADDCIAELSFKAGDIANQLGYKWHPVWHPTKKDHLAGELLLTLTLNGQGGGPGVVSHEPARPANVPALNNNFIPQNPYPNQVVNSPLIPNSQLPSDVQHGYIAPPQPIYNQIPAQSAHPQPAGYYNPQLPVGMYAPANQQAVAYGQPNYAQPNYAQPNYAQPNYAQPNYAQPNYGQPVYAQPQLTYQQPQSMYPQSQPQVQQPYAYNPNNTNAPPLYSPPSQ